MRFHDTQVWLKLKRLTTLSVGEDLEQLEAGAHCRKEC